MGESQLRFDVLASIGKVATWQWHIQKGSAAFSDRWRDLVGAPVSETLNSVDAFFSRVHPGELGELRVAIAEHFDDSAPHFEYVHRILYAQGTAEESWRWVRTRGTALRDDDNRVVSVECSLFDINDEHLAEERLEEGVFTDPLTGLPNWAFFIESVSQALGRAKRRRNYYLFVVYIGLDRFRLINESYGHLAGDRVLIQVADLLRETVPAGARVARLAGDEFGVIFEGEGEPFNVEEWGEEFITRLGTPVSADTTAFSSSASIGVAPNRISYERAEELVRDAETAMGVAKSKGKARVMLFDPSMHGRAVKLLALDGEVRKAIRQEEFVNFYQPIINLKTGKLAGFEALIRWNHPERGLLSPAEFIAFSEETGLIVPIAQWVLTDVSTQVRRWQRAYPEHGQITVSVNIAGPHLGHPELYQHVAGALHDSELPPHLFRIEVTESTVMADAEAAILTLQRLKALGVQVYVDDFGTGYSSLAYLHKLPIDSLKVDRSFVSVINEAQKESVFLHTVISLARIIGLDVIAEGIETTTQLNVMRSLDVDYGQGFLFSKPVSPEKVEELLKNTPKFF